MLVESQDFIMIHGWASNQGVWRVSRDYLGRKHRVFTLDLPPMVDVTTYRDAVGQQIENRGLKEAILVGWSMGSLVALQVADRSPEKIKGLVLVSGTCKFIKGQQYDGGLPAVLVARMKKRLVKKPQQTLREFYQLMFSERERTAGLDREIIEEYLNQGRPWVISEALAGLDYLMECDLRDQLHVVACPTLLVHGDQDEICPLRGATFMQAHLPAARLAVFAGCGHVPFLTNPNYFHQCLEEWVTSL